MVKGFMVSVAVMVLCLGLTVNLHAGAGAVGLESLKIDMGARPSSLGSAYVAIADDSNAVYWNPAGLTQIEKAESSAMLMSYVSGITIGNLNYVEPS